MQGAQRSLQVIATAFKYKWSDVLESFPPLHVEMSESEKRMAKNQAQYKHINDTETSVIWH